MELLQQWDIMQCDIMQWVIMQWDQQWEHQLLLDDALLNVAELVAEVQAEAEVQTVMVLEKRVKHLGHRMNYKLPNEL